MIQIDKTISSLDFSHMVGREHRLVLRDIRTIIVQLGEHKSVQAYFIEVTYIDLQDKKRPCFNLTKLGCELYEPRMTGEKGTQFAASYIDKFNEMENHIITTENLKTPEDIMIATLQNIKNVKAEVKTVQADIVELKQEINLTRAQKARFCK